jgi:hypothetical protein
MIVISKDRDKGIWVRKGDQNHQGDLMAICTHSHIFTKCLVCLFYRTLMQRVNRG